MKHFGSLQNRLGEMEIDVPVIKVGMGATEYGYSDREPYEVVAVKDQKHISIRQYDTVRIDNNGMSDCQQYKFCSNVKNRIINIVKKGDVWYREIVYNKNIWMQAAKADTSFKTVESAYNYYKYMSGLSTKQLDKIEQGKDVKKYTKMNIVIGKADKYYDYEF